MDPIRRTGSGDVRALEGSSCVSESADVVVVGAGIHGTSLAFHLAKKGADVVVVDRGGLASGATGTSSGWVRMHYDLAAESRLAWASFPYFTDWAEVVGGDCGFVQTGFLRLVRDERADALRANVLAQQAMGIPTQVIDAREIAALMPGIVSDAGDTAAYEPFSGYADPSGAAASLMQAARTMGTRLHQGWTVTSIEVHGSRVSKVVTDHGAIDTSVVVNAAGIGAADVGRLVGVDLPVTVWEEDVALTTRPASGKWSMPALLDDKDGFFIRPEGSDLLLVGVEDASRFFEATSGSPAQPAAGFVDAVVDRVSRRFPALEQAALVRAFSGRDGVTPDQRPIIGAVGPDGFFVACGFSGTGFKIAPAVGAALASAIFDGAPLGDDLAIFDLGRFAAGRLIVGEHPYEPLWR